MNCHNVTCKLSCPLFVDRSDKGQPAYSRQNSLFDSRSSQNLEDGVRMSPFNTRRNRSVGSHNVSSSQSPMNAWSHLKENNSDAESTASRSPPGSPSGSPTASRKQGDIQRAQSLELISSDEGDKGESKRNGKCFDIFASILLQPFFFISSWKTVLFIIIESSTHVDSEGDYRTSCGNACHCQQQYYSGLR